MHDLLWAILRSTKISNSRPLNFYPLFHFRSYFIVNKGKIKATINREGQTRGFFLEFQENESKYVLQADPEGNVLVTLKKVKNKLFIVILLLS